MISNEARHDVEEDDRPSDIVTMGEREEKEDYVRVREPICWRYFDDSRALRVRFGEAGDLLPQSRDFGNPTLPLLIELLIHDDLRVVKRDVWF